ncbi:MAG: sodium:solute symporter family protein [Ignisphaera sp.]
MIQIFMITLIAFFLLGTILSLIARKFLGRGFVEFVVGGYRVGGFLSSMTYAATTYSAFMMVGLVGLTYATGVTALGFELVYLAATVGILSTIGPLVWVKARERNWISPSQMIGEIYSSKALSAAISMLYIASLVPYLAAQFKGIGEIFGAIGLGYEAGVVFAVLATFIWVAIAGLWSIALTDAFQGLWMIIASISLFLWTLAYLLPSAGLDIVKAFDLLTNVRVSDTQRSNLLGFTWSPSMFLGMSIPWIFFAITNPQVVQRLFIPKNSYAYKKMVKYFAIYGFTYTLLCVFLGLIFRSYVAVVQPEIEFSLAKARDSVTPTILLRTPPILSSIVFVGIIAASISTADSIVLSVGSAVTKDLYIAYKGDVNDRTVLMVTHLVVGIMSLTAMIIALHRIAYVVELSVTSSVLLTPLAPITIAGVYLEPRRKGLPYVIASLLLGLIVAVIAILLFGPSRALSQPILYSMPAPLWTLAASSAPMLLLTFKSKLYQRG